MLQKFFARLSATKQWSDDEILDSYGAVLESAEMYEPISKLPASKARIKGVILNRAGKATEAEMHSLLVAYLSLARFQDSTLSGVSLNDAKSASRKTGDDLVKADLQMGPQIKSMGILNDLVALERRVLAEEWEQAERSDFPVQEVSR